MTEAFKLIEKNIFVSDGGNINEWLWLEFGIQKNDKLYSSLLKACIDFLSNFKDTDTDYLAVFFENPFYGLVHSKKQKKGFVDKYSDIWELVFTNEKWKNELLMIDDNTSLVEMVKEYL